MQYAGSPLAAGLAGGFDDVFGFFVNGENVDNRRRPDAHASPSETGEPLPDTGSDPGLPLAATALLGIVGLAFLLRARRTTA